MFIRNSLANFICRGGTAVLHLLFIPLYLERMGLEAIGLIGIFNLLISISSVFDFGMSTSLQRGNVAKVTARKMEGRYWLIALLLGSVVSWTHGTMGLALALQIPSALYIGGLLGQQRQVLASGLTLAFSLLRFLLGSTATTAETFFLWQAAVGLLQSGTLGVLFWRVLPEQGLPSEEIKRFAKGVSGIALTTLLLTQCDKMILSRTLSLHDFGLYALATSAASGLYCIISPIYFALLPQFAATKDPLPLYKRASLGMAAVLLPMGGLLSFFSHEVLLLWTRDPLIAANAAPLLSLLSLTMTCYGLTQVAYALQLALGLTRLALVQNLAVLSLLLPLTYLLSVHASMQAVAGGMLTLQFLSLTLGLFFFHRHLSLRLRVFASLRFFLKVLQKETWEKRKDAK